MSEKSLSLIQKYQREEKIGEGTYGTVYKAKDRKTFQDVAIKRVKTEDEGIPSTTLREISILKQTEHQNIVKSVFFNS
jgi:serine/threonine protein kinase